MYVLHPEWLGSVGQQHMLLQHMQIPQDIPDFGHLEQSLKMLGMSFSNLFDALRPLVEARSVPASPWRESLDDCVT